MYTQIRMKVKEWFRRFFAGIGIGTGAAIPGVSGAAIAVIFRVYEDIIGAVNSFRKRFGWAISILLPILLGIAIAVVVCIILFSYAFEHLVFILMCVFAGFLLGSFPGITDEVKGEKLNKKYVILMIIGGLFVVGLGIASVFSGLNVQALFDEMPWWLYIILIPVGTVAAVALTVPGLSGSLILLIIGFYKPLVTSTKDWAKELLTGNFTHTLPLFLMLLCFAVGCLIGVVVVSKVMNILLKKFRFETFFTIIGFIAGSVFVLFFNHEIYQYYQVWANPDLAEVYEIKQLMPMWLEIIIGIVVLLGAGALSYLLVRSQRKHAAQLEQDKPEEEQE